MFSNGSHLGSAMSVDFLIFPKPSKNNKIDLRGIVTRISQIFGQNFAKIIGS